MKRWILQALVVCMAVLFWTSPVDAQQYVELKMKDGSAVKGVVTGFEDGTWKLKDAATGAPLAPVADRDVRHVNVLPYTGPNVDVPRVPAAQDNDPTAPRSANPKARDLYMLGKSYEAEGNYDEAINQYILAKERDKWFLEARIALANAYVVSGRTGLGRHEVDEVLKIDPNNVQAMNLRIDILDRLGRVEEKHLARVEMLKRTRPIAEALYEITHYWLAHKHTNRAEKSWKAYREHDPFLKEAFCREGDLMRRAEELILHERFDEAIREYLTLMDTNVLMREDALLQVLKIRRTRVNFLKATDLYEAVEEIFLLREEIKDTGDDIAMLTRDVLTDYIRVATVEGSDAALIAQMRKAQKLLPPDEFIVIWANLLTQVDARLGFPDTKDAMLRMVAYVAEETLTIPKRNEEISLYTADLLVRASKMTARDDDMSRAVTYIRLAAKLDPAREGTIREHGQVLYYQALQDALDKTNAGRFMRTILDAETHMKREQLLDLYTFAGKLMKQFVVDQASIGFAHEVADALGARIKGDPSLPNAMHILIGEIYLGLADASLSRGELDTGVKDAKNAVAFSQDLKPSADRLIREFFDERLIRLAREGSLDRVRKELLYTRQTLDEDFQTHLTRVLITEARRMVKETPMPFPTENLADMLYTRLSKDNTLPASLDAELAVVFRRLGSRALARQEFENAVVFFDRAVDLNPVLKQTIRMEIVDARKAAANLAIAQGNLERAEAHLRMLIAMGLEDDPWLTYNQAKIDNERIRAKLKKAKYLSEKIMLIRNYIDNDPGHADFLEWAKALRDELVTEHTVARQETEKQMREFYPLVPGSVYTYRVSTDNRFQEIRVLGMEKDDALATYDMERTSLRKDDAGNVLFSTSEEYALIHDGSRLYTTRNGRETTFLRFPLDMGTEAWTWKEGATTFKREVIAIDETVETPAGTFERVRKVKFTSSMGNTEVVSHSYYAPGVGLIKIDYEGVDQHDMVLDSYTIPE
jgi:tetratricopeptide (TPR) repeat protein